MVIELVIIVYAFDDMTLLLSEDSRTLVGWVVIGVSTLIIVLQMIIDVKQHLIFMAQHYKSLKRLIERLSNYIKKLRNGSPKSEI
jgi:uncharacterized membrane protein